MEKCLQMNNISLNLKIISLDVSSGTMEYPDRSLKIIGSILDFQIYIKAIEKQTNSLVNTAMKTILLVTLLVAAASGNYSKSEG
jgi:hypothetical protein